MERATETIQLLESSLREQGLETAVDGSIPERPGMRVLIPVRDGKLNGFCYSFHRLFSPYS